jgi:formyltetrahydrofolate dehydrogenase
MRIVVIGQAAFGAEVLKQLIADGHEIAAVFTVPDGKRPDPVAAVAEESGLLCKKFARYRVKGSVVPECLQAMKDAAPELCVLAFVTQFVPKEIYDFPPHGSIVYHPSMLPLHRGASAINHTIMAGEKEAGFTIFYADDGLDTGDIILQRSTPLGTNENLNSVYKRFLFPEGVKGFSDVVRMIGDGSAPRIVQEHKDHMDPPYYDQKWQKPAKINWSQPAQAVHDFIRGSDRQPGAFTVLEGKGQVTLYDSELLVGSAIRSANSDSTVRVECESAPTITSGAIITSDGLVFQCGDGGQVLIKTVKIGSDKPIGARGLFSKNAKARL